MKLLIERLTAANPGWVEWGELIVLAESLSFEKVIDEHLGTFYTSGRRLVFAEPGLRQSWTAWLPHYVPAHFGLKADDWEVAGGYADSFCNRLATRGAVFSPAGNDDALGFPLIDVPPDVYAFQSNSDGAQFFVNKSLEIVYPNADDKCFETLDTLEEFTKKNVRQALNGKTWIGAYSDLKRTLLD